MTEIESIAAHRELAAYHAKLATGAILDIIHEYHRDLSERLDAEADRLADQERVRQEREAAR